MKCVLIAAAGFAFCAAAGAEMLELGSMKMRPCEKVVLEIRAPHFARVKDEIRRCAERGVAAATLPALLKNLPAAEPAFWEEFQLCSRYTEWAHAHLSVQKRCRY